MASKKEEEKKGHVEKAPPHPIKKILDDVASQITDGTIQFPSKFHFTWYNIDFSGQILHSKATGIFSIKLLASLGHIPFSAEDKPRREKLLEKFTPLFIKGEYKLSNNSQIQMVMQTDFTGPFEAKRLMAALTYSLLDLQEDLNNIKELING